MLDWISSQGWAIDFVSEAPMIAFTHKCGCMDHKAFFKPTIREAFEYLGGTHKAVA